MEKLSKYSWALIGYNLKDTTQEVTEEFMGQILEKVFVPDAMFQLFLCGAFMDKFASLEEMETGLDLIISEMEEYHVGDYCIVSEQEEGSLLFLPFNAEDYDKNISGDINNM